MAGGETSVLAKARSELVIRGAIVDTRLQFNDCEASPAVKYLNIAFQVWDGLSCLHKVIPCHPTPEER